MPCDGDLDHYLLLFEHAPDGFLTTDPTGRIREANRAAASLFRLPQGDLVGRPLVHFVSPEQKAAFVSRLRRLRASGRSRVREWQVRMQPPHAEPIETALALAALKGLPSGPVLFLWVVRDITRRRRIERRLREGEEQYRLLYRRVEAQRDALRVLSHRYLYAREEEAKRIAHQLHDEAGQVTTSIHLALAEIARDLPPRSRGRLRRINRFVQDIEDRLRRLSHELRPTILDDLGLVPALEFLADGFSARSGVSTVVLGSTAGRLAPAVETTIYRIVQEALTNVARHAHATRVSIRLKLQNGLLRCWIQDDGVGFDAGLLLGSGRKTGLGLLGVGERLDAIGGRFRIRSNPGGGTLLSIAVPLGRFP